jgi:hypothetical protein
MKRRNNAHLLWFLGTLLLWPGLSGLATDWIWGLSDGIPVGWPELALAVVDAAFACFVFYLLVRYLRAPRFIWWAVAVLGALMVLEWVVGLIALALGHGDSWGMSLAYDGTDNVLPLAQQLDWSSMVDNLISPLLAGVGAFLGARLGGKAVASHVSQASSETSVPAGEDGASEPLIYGDGEFPSELDRLNWGMLLLPGFWTFFYGMWRWWLITLAVWAGMLILGWRLRVAAGSRLSDPVWALAVMGLVIVPWVVHLWLATNANRALWLHEAKRLARSGASNTVEAIVAWQRTWAWIGWAIFGLGFVSAAWDVIGAPKKTMGGGLGVAAGAVVSVGAVAVAYLTARKGSGRICLCLTKAST